MVLHGTKGLWTSFSAILDTGAGPSLARTDASLPAGASLTRKMRINCPQSASNEPMEIKGLLSLEAQMWQHQKKIGFLVMTSMTTNVMLRTVFIYISIMRIILKAKLSTPIDLSPVEIMYATRQDHILTTDSKEVFEMVCCQAALWS